KFTSEGHVLMEAFCNKREDGQAQMCLRVQDTGIGIPKSQESKLFQKFTQADSSTTRKYGGTGLGLAICKNIAEMMHGTIAVSAAPERGSIFTVEIPLQEASETALSQNAVAADGLKTLRFLIIDDNEVNRRVLTEQ